jgi:hypothetical protein
MTAYLSSADASATATTVRGAQRQRSLRAGIIAGFWLCFGLLNGSQLYLGLRMENFPASAARIYAWSVVSWGSWALLTPPVLWLGRRFPLERATWPRTLPIHFGACVLIAAAHIAFFEYMTVLIAPYGLEKHPRPFWDMFLGRATTVFHLELLIYGATLGLAYAVNYYVRFRERETRAAQLEAQLTQAQLQALKMQLHPHFLFNTLNGIAGLVRDNRNKAAVDMLVGLSDLLRYTLENAGKQEVPLSEELEFLELYLNIQQMRFPDRLSIELHIAPETLRALVPNLLLQPLVENAIRHGIAPRATRGTVGVRAAHAAEVLQLEVYDDGPGLRADGNTRKGIGLTNTRARLAQLYGAAHSFSVTSRAEGGTSVRLSIPFQPAGSSDGRAAEEDQNAHR